MPRRVVLYCLVSVLLALGPPMAEGQVLTGTIHRKANLRERATTHSAVLEGLHPGDEVRIVELQQRNGFYHVQTDGGVEGWVYRTLLHVDESDTLPTLPLTGPSEEISPDWSKPALKGSRLTGPLGFDPCPASGELGSDVGTNRRKNRVDVPSSYHEVTVAAIAELPYPDAPTNRNKWSAEQLEAIAPFEGVAVSVVGYVVAVKKQSGGSGEATNCHFNAPNFVDVHVALVAQPGDGEKEAIVVEPTPRFYGKHPAWVWSKLKALDDAATPVRISGWLLLDPVHKGHLETYRSTLWEIHPVTKIEVFRDGKWMPW